MRRYLLDTSPLSSYLSGRSGALSLMTPWVRAREAVTSIVIYGEVVEYLRSHPHPRRKVSELRRLLQEVRPIILSYSILERYADLRRQMRAGGLIGDVDSLIAATALEHSLTVVTIDEDFRRVPGLSVMLLVRAQLR